MNLEGDKAEQNNLGVQRIITVFSMSIGCKHQMVQKEFFVLTK